MSSSNQNINPKNCSYGCNTRIYWNNSQNAYWEVFSKKKHVCPNRTNKTTISTTTNTNNASVNPPFYNKKSWVNKPKMSNSLELLQGPIQDIQKKYEILSDIVSVANGKVHGSQSHINGNIISLVVYFEVPEGKRKEVKQRFKNSILSIKTTTSIIRH
jgi:hypothetical protein